MVKCFSSFSVLSSLHLYQNMKTLEQGWNTSKKKRISSSLLDKNVVPFEFRFM